LHPPASSGTSFAGLCVWSIKNLCFGWRAVHACIWRQFVRPFGQRNSSCFFRWLNRSFPWSFLYFFDSQAYKRLTAIEGKHFCLEKGYLKYQRSLIHTHTHAHTHTHLHTHTHIHTLTHTFTFIHAHTHTQTISNTHTCISLKLAFCRSSSRKGLGVGHRGGHACSWVEPNLHKSRWHVATRGLLVFVIALLT